MDVLNKLICFLSLFIWLVIGVLVLASKKRADKERLCNMLDSFNLSISFKPLVKE